MNKSKSLPSLLLAVFITGALLFHAALCAKAQTTNNSSRKSPEWLRNAVVYQIFPRNFSQTGDFNSITGRLNELQDLGVDILWLMPIHPIGEKLKKGTIGSPYCVRDFYSINPDYGTTNDFKRLVSEAHQHGMKVLIDLVAGHTAWDSVLMEHPEFYKKDSAGRIISPNPDWPDVAGLNYENANLRRYMIDMLKYWMKEFGVDGFRCDVAYTVPVDFWEAARIELEKVNPQVLILAEAGGKPPLLTRAFDMDSSWNLYSTLNRVMSGEAAAAFFLRDSWQHTHDQFPEGALHLRYSDTHHEPRAVARYGMDGALAAQVLMLTLDGVPLFYNGMEVGDATESSDPALFEKVPILWQPTGRPPLRDIYRDLIRLRKKYTAFSNGDVVWTQNSAPAEVISFLRRDAKDEFLVVINFSSRRMTGTVELSDAGGFDQVKISGVAEPVGTVLPDFNLKGHGWLIYHRSLTK